MTRAAARGDLRRDEPRDRARCTRSTTPRAGLADYGKPGNYFARQIARWSKQYRVSETERIEAMERLIAWLPANIPAGDETALVHGDYRLDNMIFAAPTAPRVLARARLGALHPRASARRLLLSRHALAHDAAARSAGCAGIDLAALGIPTEAEYLASYCRRTGRAAIEPRVWEFCMAYNLFRIASIRQGIMRRVLEGTAASRHAREVGRAGARERRARLAAGRGASGRLR